MKRATQRQEGRPALEMIEEAVHLLRTAPASALAAYYAGGLPFVLGLLYFWSEMSRSAYGERNLATGSLLMAVLFLWMKFCQALYARRLRSCVAGREPAPLGLARLRRIFFQQAALQPFGLFLLPLALVPAVPFGWVYAWYQSITVLGDGESPGAGTLGCAGFRQARLWPAQNHSVLVLLFGFGLVVFVNWGSICFIVPGLAKTLLGIESIFTRSGMAGFNTTFLAAMCGLTYLTVDPILKAVYVLRCFYGEALASGEDLKSELRQFDPAGGLAMPLVLAALVFASGNVLAAETTDGEARLPDSAPALKAENDSRAQPSAPRASVAAPELDRTISQVLTERKYAWRLPREKVKEETPADQGVISRFLSKAADLLRKWITTLRDWFDAILQKLFPRKLPTPPSASGYGWMATQQVLLYLLVLAAAAALLFLAYKVWRARTSGRGIIAGEAMLPTPDITDQNVGADQLPEDGWLRLARELAEKGEWRLALRALYLASLANLAQRNLISIAKFKSNLDYERELRRRGHAFPALLDLFGENVSVFERIWYGLHEVNPDLVSQFANNVERIRAGG